MKKLLMKPVLFTLLLMLFLTFTIVKAQTSITLHDTDESLVLEISSESQDDKPVNIILVYDTNSIALETQKSGNTYNRNILNVSSNSNNSLSALENIMAVDIEDDIKLEDWMLTPFEYKESFDNYTLPDREEDISLESWMMNLNEWML